jgi:hypothetical protein
MKNAPRVALMVFSLPGVCIAKSQTLLAVPDSLMRQRHPTPQFQPYVDNHTPGEIPRGGATKSKLGGFATRTLSAVVVLSAPVILIKRTGKQGIIGLVLAAQIGLFSEAVHVSAVAAPSKWWTLLTNMIYWDAKYF